MVPKSERFEMRVDPELLNRVDEWSTQQPDFPSRAQAMRRLVEGGLQQSSPSAPPTNYEKLGLWMMAEILKNQENGKTEDGTAELVQSAIYGGHYWAWDWEMTGIMHSHVDQKRSLNEVVDTLDMWIFIERGFANLSQKDKDHVADEVGPWGKDPKFHGFDGNNETEHMSIANFLVNDLDRFQSLSGRSFNSHAPRVARYREMVRVFERLRVDLHSRELNADEIIELLQRE